MHTAKLRPFLSIVIALAIGSLSAACRADEAPAAATNQTIQVAGLKQAAEILIDRWGVPHIYAQSRDDAFFVQGFNAARDRLFQIDLWRRRGLGQLASVFGPSFVEQDRAARLFLYRGDMQKEWDAYGKDAEAISKRFVDGINAYVDYVGGDPARLPFEFRQFNYPPAKWQAEDVVRIRSHGLTRNLTGEVARSKVVCAAGLKSGLKADHFRVGLTPKWETKIPEGLDPCLPADVLKVFTLATQNVALTRAPAAKAALHETPTELRLAAIDVPEPPLEGSNNWVIAPDKSATGRAIMANDPHRAYSTPSLRYLTHLSAPDMDVIGAGEPSLPGISIGHNGSIAFGLTIFGIDQEDLYVYALNPADPDEYQYRGKWEKFRQETESIPVKGEAPAQAAMMYTRHGPVIYIDTAKQRAYAVRSGWLEAGMAPYFGSIDYMFAKNFAEFKRAMLHWGAPTENQVYADTQGNIGWVPGGLTPIRRNWDGLMPVPGDGRYEWSGFLAGDKLPFSYNPKPGWFASANELNLPRDYPYREHKIGFEWPSSARYNRLKEVLSRPGKISIEDSMRLQNDVLSNPARRITALLKDLQPADARAQAALKLLRGWDCVQNGDSAPAALFEVWWSRYLGAVFKEAVLGKAVAASMGNPDSEVLMTSLEKPQAVFARDAVALRNQILIHSLTLAWLDMERLLGKDPGQWQWGKLHRTLMAHPFAAAVDEATRNKLNVGPIAKNGSAHTPNQSSYDVNTFLQTGGPSVRLVIDVGNWDNSRAINTPGQSGDPDNPHYRDLAQMWRKGEYFPLLYSRPAVEAATTQRINLQPQS